MRLGKEIKKKLKDLILKMKAYSDETKRMTHLRTERVLRRSGYSKKAIKEYRMKIAKKKGKDYKDFEDWLYQKGKYSKVK